MGAEPVDFSPPPPPEPTLSPEPEISGKDRGGVSILSLVLFLSSSRFQLVGVGLSSDFVTAYVYVRAWRGTGIQNWKADMMSALGESVSFGRFLSEPLEWGKRSAFAHNRYLEEAAVQARPGSVAQKKAFFEAHYARKKRKSEDHAAAASDDVAGGDGELEAAEDGGAASWSLSATESSCMTDEPPAPAEEVCCGWEEDRVVDCGGSASDKPVHVPEELADITDAVGPCCRMDAPTDETQHMEGGDEVVGAVLPLQKQDLCMDSLTAVDATLKVTDTLSLKNSIVKTCF
jgi:hypothetical protein